MSTATITRIVAFDPEAVRLDRDREIVKLYGELGGDSNRSARRQISETTKVNYRTVYRVIERAKALGTLSPAAVTEGDTTTPGA